MGNLRKKKNMNRLVGAKNRGRGRLKTEGRVGNLRKKETMNRLVGA